MPTDTRQQAVWDAEDASVRLSRMDALVEAVQAAQAAEDSARADLNSCRAAHANARVLLSMACRAPIDSGAPSPLERLLSIHALREAERTAHAEWGQALSLTREKKLSRKLAEAGLSAWLDEDRAPCPLFDGRQADNDEQIGRCRVCGCTDNDCRQCIERTGEPCHWVEPDLCSACAQTEDEQITQEIEAAQDKPLPPLKGEPPSELRLEDPIRDAHFKVAGEGVRSFTIEGACWEYTMAECAAGEWDVKWTLQYTAGTLRREDSWSRSMSRAHALECFLGAARVFFGEAWLDQPHEWPIGPAQRQTQAKMWGYISPDRSFVEPIPRKEEPAPAPRKRRKKA